MPITVLRPVDFQQLLITHGFPLPQYGADGYWGQETAQAVERWFEVGHDLAAPPPPAPQGGIVPADWMPDCSMSKVIVHWTAGAYSVSSTDKQHYHIIVAGDGTLVRGDHPISDNVSTADDDYAAHTKSCNTGSIGISAACMAGAIENPFNPGAYPLTELQWLTLAAVAADLCRNYGINVTPTTVLQHGEVEDNLGIDQDSKWDINKLPFAADLSAAEVGDAFREAVSRL